MRLNFSSDLNVTDFVGKNLFKAFFKLLIEIDELSRKFPNYQSLVSIDMIGCLEKRSREINWFEVKKNNL